MYIVDGLRFRSKQELVERVQEILNRHPLGTLLEANERTLVLAVLGAHPEWPQASVSGVAGVQINPGPRDNDPAGRTRCFWVIGTDYQSRDLGLHSAVRALQPDIHYRPPQVNAEAAAALADQQHLLPPVDEPESTSFGQPDDLPPAFLFDPVEAGGEGQTNEECMGNPGQDSPNMFSLWDEPPAAAPTPPPAAAPTPPPAAAPTPPPAAEAVIASPASVAPEDNRAIAAQDQAALYRRYRSSTFDAMVGQGHIVATLRNAIAQGRVRQAYLFTGPRGVGKTSAARLLAKAVNCLDPDPRRRPCGCCASCIAIAEDRMVDLIEFDAASHTSVEDAREIIERVHFRPSEGQRKVYIIDEVHQLSSAAFNALLKTLEEPPDHVLFILATTEVHKVPETIRSRCQQFTFTRHTTADIAAHLRHVASCEGLSLEDGVATAVARAATGSMRDALTTLDQLAATGADPITIEHVRALFGTPPSEAVGGLAQALLNGDLGAILRLVTEAADRGDDLRQVNRALIMLLRAALAIAAGGEADRDELNESERETVASLASACPPGRLVQWLHQLSLVDQQARSTYGQLAFEVALANAVLEVSAASTGGAGGEHTPQPVVSTPSPPVRPAPARPPATHQPTQPAPRRPQLAGATPAPEPAVGTASVELQQVTERWEAITRLVGQRNTKLSALLRNVRPVRLEEATLHLVADFAFHQGEVLRSENKAQIEQTLNQVLGRTWTIACALVED